ncbi:MAG: hypothetical protein LIO76_11180 [Clostridiales bacterium]|nr:hypothetical protein [Clostridiales bacterium]
MKKAPIRVVFHGPDTYIDKPDENSLRLEQANTFLVSQAVRRLNCSQEQIQAVLDRLTAMEKEK